MQNATFGKMPQLPKT